MAEEAFITAARKGNIDSVNKYLEDGVNVNTQDDTGSTALILAASNGHDAVVRRLLDEDTINVNLRDNQINGTALFWAALAGHNDIVRKLIRVGDANMNRTDMYGNTPLMMAAHAGYSDVVKTFIDSGVDLDRTNKNGETAFDVASTEEIATMLKAAEAANEAAEGSNSSSWGGSRRKRRQTKRQQRQQRQQRKTRSCRRV